VTVNPSLSETIAEGDLLILVGRDSGLEQSGSRG
jgi:K+/H+ antiporter YhaU regulatory subunit KhtT